jgi:endo-alpha-1,4-polygalactosaminidase (GH114 family)
VKDFVIGIGFYKREQWTRLLERASDSYRLESSYDEWLEVVTSSVEKIRAQGIKPVLVDVDIEELTDYCKKKGLENNGATRSMFVAELARRKGSPS